MSVAVISNNTLTVDGAAYESDAFITLLQVLGVSQLTISPAEVESDEDESGNFTVTGDAELFSQRIAGAEIYLDFSSDVNFEFQLKAVIPSLSLSTLKDRGILLTSELSDIAELLSLEFKDANFVFDSERAQTYFGIMSSDSNLTMLESAGISLDKIGFEFLREYGENMASLLVLAEVELGSVALDLKITIPLGSGLAAQVWTLNVGSIIQLTSGLEDMIAFLDRTSLLSSFGLGSFGDVIPDQLKQIPDFLMDEIQIQCDPLQGEIRYLSFRVKSAHPYDVADGLFIIDNIGLRMAINPSSAKPSFSMTLFGVVKFGADSYVNISVLLPEDYTHSDWVYSMSGVIDLKNIADIEELPINLSIGELLLPDNFFTIDSLSLNLFEIDFNPVQATISSIELDVDFYAACEVIHGLSIENPSFSVSITNPFQQSSLGSRKITGSISGTMVVGDISFGIEAKLTETGWSFKGETTQGAIPIGQLISSLGQEFGISLPNFINDLALDTLSLSFSTKTETGESGQQTNSSSELLFTCGGGFPIDDKPVHLLLNMNVTRASTGGYSNRLTGTLTIGSVESTGSSVEFTASFSNDTTYNFFVAAYLQKDETPGTNIKALMAQVSSTVSEYIPEGLSVELKDVIFAYEKTNAVTTTATTTSETRFLFGFDVGTGINLSNLPLVGHEFPADQTIGVDDLRVMVASKLFNQSLVSQLNALLPEEVTKLPVRELGSGLSISAMMQFGGSPDQLDLPVASDSTTTQQTTTPTSTTTTPSQTSDGIKWFKLQKAFGPVTFQRVGVQYKEEAVWFLLDAAITEVGLTLILNGLSVGSPLNSFDPKFDLLGLGVNYKGGSAVEIGGDFLRKRVERDGEEYDEYDGAVVIKAEDLTISALGSYAELEGHPSLFVYGVLDYPIGGPAFFFVTGLAAGFGYNRKLVTPALDQVAKFPLVQEAMSGKGTPNDLMAEMNSLQAYIPPSIGDNFLVFGIKFTSFKIIDSFALLTVLFGNRLEVNVLGLSTLIVPTPEAGKTITPLAKVQMELKATYYPDDGLLAIDAKLTADSFIFSRNCHLSGGFAFYTWFTGEHAGDFVQTLGGYHPDFNIPSHYPAVPRLSFNWKVDKNLTLKGDAYYAITPSMLMAGGSLEATWKDGNIKAWFTAKADFLISWKPYHYDAHIKVSVGVSYKFKVEVLGATVHKTITADVSADVHVWGPEFSGKAHVDITVVSFNIEFGSKASKKKEPIDWTTFNGSFLPTKDTTCSISVGDGLISAPDDELISWVMNPKRFYLVTNSAIPAKAAYISRDKSLVKGEFQSSFGVAPMEVKSANLSSDFFIVIERKDPGTGEYDSAEKAFEINPILKDIPAAMWGQTMTPGLKGQTFIKQALCGFGIRPAYTPSAHVTKEIYRSKLQYATDPISDAFEWASYETFRDTAQDNAQRTESISETILAADVVSTRAKMMDALGVSVDLKLSPDIANSFLVAPLIESTEA